MSTAHPASHAHLVVGRVGERAAEIAYVRRGYRVLGRNWRCGLGELDLVFARGDLVVFCEVKTRRGRRYGEPWQAVDARKQVRLRHLAQAFLIARALRPSSTRYDVASVLVAADGEATVRVFEDAF